MHDSKQVCWKDDAHVQRCEVAKRCPQVLLSSPNLAKDMSPLVEAVTPILAEAVAKAAVRSDGIAALLIVALLAAQDAAAASHSETQKVRSRLDVCVPSEMHLLVSVLV